jgi:hypothetical protein
MPRPKKIPSEALITDLRKRLAKATKERDALLDICDELFDSLYRLGNTISRLEKKRRDRSNKHYLPHIKAVLAYKASHTWEEADKHFKR